MQRDIRLPSRITNELAEDVGFHIGDGYMKKRIDSFGTHYDFVYAGSNPGDMEYFENCLIPRKKALFNLDNLKVKNHRTKKALMLKFQSKDVFLFYRDFLKVQESPKVNIRLPEWIFDSIKLQVSVLRGLFDSDGCFKTVKNNYPIIDTRLQSKFLRDDIAKICQNLEIGFSVYSSKYTNKSGKTITRHVLQICGHKNVGKWMRIVGFNNPKHQKRYEKYKMGQGRIELPASAL